jgi:polyhydroxyalkanoate synthase subunit PhaC
VNLAGPFDFSESGLLGEMVNRKWFDADAVAAAGNVGPSQMQSGFVALRPTTQLAKWVGLLDRGHDPAARESFDALEAWAGDNIPFPGAAYATYIRELYQEKLLVKGQHHVAGRRVDLGAIRCPVLTVIASKDTICPPAAACALNDKCGAEDREVLTVAGGHVGAVVGGKAPKVLYPALSSWLRRRLATALPS